MSGTDVVGLFGAGGFGREVMPLARHHFEDRAGSAPPVLYFVDDAASSPLINGYPVISESDFFRLPGTRYFNVTIADSKAREKIVGKCLDNGAIPLALLSRQSTVYEENEIGEGAIFCANTVVTSNARIGRYFHCNIYSYVAHDCVIGDYVTFAPNVHCNGNVHIHDHAYIGTGAILKHGSRSKPLVIGEGAVVGMGAVVTKDVAPFTTVIGNPARPLAPKS